MRKKNRLGVVISCVLYKDVKMSIRPALLGQTKRARKLGIPPPDAAAVQQKFVGVVESGFKCVYCGIEFEWGDRALHPTIDHRTPISRGGNNDTDNLVFCCQRCNKLKYILTDDEYIYLVSMVEDRYKTSWVHNERFSREIIRLKTKHAHAQS